MAASPVTPADIPTLTATADPCDKMRLITNLPVWLREFIGWVVNDNGDMTQEFITELLENTANLFFGTDSGAADALAITVANYPHATIQPHLLITPVAVSNTGGSGGVSLTLNAFTAVPVMVGGSIPELGNLVAGRTYAFYFNGVNYQILNPSTPGFPENVYVTSAWTPEVDGASIDLNLVLPAGKARWRTVKMCATAKMDSNSGATPTAVQVTLKWNCGSLLDTPVVISASAGAGNSGNTYDYDFPDVQDYPVWQWEGQVPDVISTQTPLVVRATLSLTGSVDLGEWQLWAVASA